MLVSTYIYAQIIFWKVIRFLHGDFALYSVKIVGGGMYIFYREKTPIY